MKENLCERVHGVDSMTWKGSEELLVGRTCLRGIRNNILHFQWKISMKKSIENGQVCNQTTMREILERFDEAWIIYEKDGFRLDFVKTL